MKLKYFLFIWIITLIPCSLNARKIKISLPLEANKPYAFILNKGIKQDTIQKGVIPFTGEFEVKIPAVDTEYVGMAFLGIQNAESINMIINHEDFTLRQEDGKFVFDGSPENQYLYSLMQGEATPKQDTALYASRFVDMIRFLKQLNRVSDGIDLNEKAKVRRFAIYDLNLEELYTSSIWYNVIDGIVKLYSDQQALGKDMVILLNRVKSQEVFEHLSENLITITEQFGLDDAFNIIVPAIEQSGRIQTPQGDMYRAFALAKVRKGSEAPSLKGLGTSFKDAGVQKTLLMFYAPDCENCHAQLEQLIALYQDLRKQKVRIITISSATDQNEFYKEVNRFPWDDSDKLCDFKGFAGENFVNYGIMSTPSFFLLDSDGRVIKRFALTSEIGF